MKDHRAPRETAGRAGILPAAPGFQPGASNGVRLSFPEFSLASEFPKPRDFNVRYVPGWKPGTAGRIPALP